VVLIVDYVLSKRFRDYHPLFEALKNNSSQSWHFSDSTWIVNTNLSANEYAERLLPYIETTDSLLVVRITREHQGWLPKEAWDWLNDKQY